MDGLAYTFPSCGQSQPFPPPIIPIPPPTPIISFFSDLSGLFSLSLSLSLLLPLSSFIFNLNLILILHMIIIIMLSNSYSSPSSCHMFNPKVKRPGSLLTHQTPLSPQAQFRLFGCRDNGRKSPIKVFLKNPAYISWDHYFKSQSDHFWT